MYIHRQIEPNLMSMSKQLRVVALSGPRQAGKSTLLKQLFTPRYQFVTFDDPLVRDQALADPKASLETFLEQLNSDQ